MLSLQHYLNWSRVSRFVEVRYLPQDLQVDGVFLNQSSMLDQDYTPEYFLSDCPVSADRTETNSCTKVMMFVFSLLLSILISVPLLLHLVQISLVFRLKDLT